MKTLFVSIFMLLACTIAVDAQTDIKQPNPKMLSHLPPKPDYAHIIIPQPNNMTIKGGEFVTTNNTKLYLSMKGNDKIMMEQYISTLPIKFTKGTATDKINVVRLIAVDTKTFGNKEVDNEAYTMNITNTGVEIKGGYAGIFYGLQSLLQLMQHQAGNVYTVPISQISDSPLFPHRGFMLDVSRHFFPKEVVKKQIDALSYFKINRLHLHLTDAGGWRIEIKKYPLLTQKTAYRTSSDWTQWWNDNNDRRYASPSDPGAYGGFYTQEDIKEIVKYAQIHNITVVPEVEMPGHSDEVLMAYPSLSCSGQPYVNGEFCIGKEDTFIFLENVLKEIMALFPSEYIHIGGDEANKTAWKACPLCQARMQKEGLKTEEELQSYMICRMEKFLNANGRKLMGWDEILEGKLAPNATVMSWRGEQGGITAAKSGHDVVMTPSEYCYLDYYQDAPSTQPKGIGGFVTLKKTYSYNPIPDTIEAIAYKHIRGVQGNLWTEYVPNAVHLEYMMYPRILALAEVGWSKFTQHPKSYDEFRNRVIHATDVLKSKGYHPFDIRNEVGARPISRTLTNHEARGKKVTYNAPYNKSYAAGGDVSLTDGKRGNWHYGDGVWQGFISRDRIDVTIDMGKETTIRDISAEYIQSVGAEVFFPSEIVISVSSDNVNFTEVCNQTFDVTKTPDVGYRTCSWSGNFKARYIRYKARAGKQYGGWLFTDEIVVNQIK